MSIRAGWASPEREQRQPRHGNPRFSSDHKRVLPPARAEADPALCVEPSGDTSRQAPASFAEPQDAKSDDRFQFMLQHGSVRKIEGQDRIIFAELPHMPGVLVVYRSPVERASSPQRLSLERKDLTHCPLLEGEVGLRILSYQNNQITAISNLVSLPNLVFLDLSNNRISAISNLDTVPTLRVLKLAKNKISTLCNLEALQHLDVLDMHGNAVQRIEGLDGSTELRVLNLASNQLSEVNNLSHLRGLTELNVRRNMIAAVSSLQNLPLQRLYLSQNQISDLEALENILLPTLTELALDGNEVTKVEDYRTTVLSKCPDLAMLDQLPVAPAAGSPKSGSPLHLPLDEERDRDDSLRNNRLGVPSLPGARSQSDRGGSSPTVTKGQEAKPSPSRTGSAERSNSEQRRRAAMRRNKRGEDGAKSVPSRKDVLNEIQTQWHTAVQEGRTPITRYGYVKREEIFELFIYGRGLDTLDKVQYQQSVSAVHFHYVLASSVVNSVARLQKFEKLESITFGRNQIKSIAELSPLSSLPKLRSLTILHNPINESHVMFRELILQSFPMLDVINARPVSLDERTACASRWAVFNQLATERNPLLEDGLKQRTVPEVSEMVDAIVTHATAVDEKIRCVNVHLDQALLAAIEEAFEDVRSVQDSHAMQKWSYCGEASYG
uniref:Uncharacterized protein n=1 Tax=Oxyrrhis marina TaxID=2969 RepID=A0A7S4GPD4_OXYMA|mmetsp:Transcript_33680/g.81524  ORF Transcript_33680/g.81524 Transcript_33680/m.81524 type:complete len:666 (+) Transcript_33680:11-2008(+)